MRRGWAPTPTRDSWSLARSCRCRANDPVVVVANFSDFGSEQTPDGIVEYRVPNWPATPVGRRWREVTQDRSVPQEWVGRESLFAWEAKVYALS